MTVPQNPNCTFILRGDYNDCAHAGGGRGAKDKWCESCLFIRRVLETFATDPNWAVVDLGAVPE